MATREIELVVIGGSAGAIDALTTILPALPREFPLPIALVIHLAPTGRSHLPELLGTRCELTVKEAEDKEPLAPATLYVAPPNYHLLVEATRHVSLSVDAPVHYSRPAIDVLFESAADAGGPAVAGVLLTGASEDGAWGLLRIAQAGGTTVVQSPDTAAAPTMPQAALRRCHPTHVLPVAEIGPWLARLGRRAAERSKVR
jgi:two-component system, chemotaxis family, protein-glutamate methylesterase/glutaminase